MKSMLVLIGALVAGQASAGAEEVKGLADLAVFGKEQQAEAKGMIGRWIKRRTQEFNEQHRQTWAKVQTREQWEKYRDERIARLRASLGTLPRPLEKTARLSIDVTRSIEGEGFTIDNLIFEGPNGLPIAGNLYRPAKKLGSMPGMLIAHAHHNGKTHGELQDMGMTWARAGCLVLVIDQVGYGERRNHPFHSDADYTKPYRTSRQDYYFRYDAGVQLQLLGDSLMGWMVGDLMRGVDVLLRQDGIDPARIILLGGVAGGGDPAGVTAALDARIACCVPFNFGGPQPETRYPLPEDAETSFNYLLFTYWDSTRGLRLGASGDFPHWLIVASTAPRHLIHAHEFSWDGPRDPVWKRYQKVWGEFYGARSKLGVAHGKGILQQSPPQASHCGHIGAFHRRMIHPLFKEWFGIEAEEYHAPRSRDELTCRGPKTDASIRKQTLSEVMAKIGAERVAQARDQLMGKSAAERRLLLRASWSKLLGPVTPALTPKVIANESKSAGKMRVDRVVLEVEPGIVVPLLVVGPVDRRPRRATVVCLAQDGKRGFLQERSEQVEKLLRAGVLVVLPDVRGTGETRSGSWSGRDSSDTDHSVHVQLFGETLLGQRLRDLRSVLAYLRGRADVDGRRLALWGDSFAPVNGPETNFQVPHGVDGRPRSAAPLGAMLALLGALTEDDLRAVYLAGGIVGYQGALSQPSVLIPHGDAVPGGLAAGDVAPIAGSLAPLPLKIEALVDHSNRPVSQDGLEKAYASALRGYAGAANALEIAARRSEAAAWLLRKLAE